MLKILSPAELSEDIQNKIISVSDNIELYVTKEEKELEKLWPEIDIMFSGRLTPEILKKAKNLKWFQATSAGVDRYMFDEFIKSDIALTNVRGMHGQTIAEHVIMKMLAIYRNLPLALKQQNQKVWSRYNVNILFGKTILIVGLGGIGKRIAEITSHFGMNVIAVNRSQNSYEFANQIYKTDELHKALSLADFVIIATPLTDKTYHMISTEEFKAMKESSIFINIGRGPVVDQKSLIKALEEKEISFAALDVFENEPLEEESPLWNMDNVIITPHMAGDMPNYIDNATDIFVKNLKLFIQEKPLLNIVNKKEQY